MSEETRKTDISEAETLAEIAEFWDTHSVADYWDQTREVEIDVRAQRRHRVTIDAELYEQLEVQAQAQGMLPETLVNLWVAERLRHLGSSG
jgi:uncharacterized membrane protein